MALIYMATNTINGKRYIGITSQLLAKRISQHFCHARNPNNDWAFYRAIKKYGRKVFSFSVILECSDYDIALREEIRLIEELKPEYNVVGGGRGGTLGKKMSDATKRKISVFHKGKQWRLGTKQSDEVKDNLKRIGLKPENRERWNQYASLGPVARERPVKCITDGTIYPSAAKAARKYGIHHGSLIELCRGQKGRKTVGGLIFSYLNEGAE
jgi:group I intron endonuclease